MTAVPVAADRHGRDIEVGVGAFDYTADLMVIETWLGSHTKTLSPHSVRAFRFEARRWLCWLAWNHFVVRHDTDLAPVLQRADSLDGVAYLAFLRNPQTLPHEALWPMAHGGVDQDGTPTAGKQLHQVQHPWRVHPDPVRPHKNKPLSRASYSRAVTVLRGMYQALSEMSIAGMAFPTQPFRALGKISEAQGSYAKKAVLKRELRYINEALEQLAAARDPLADQLRWVWTALTRTGLRRAELAAATTATIVEEADEDGHPGAVLKVVGKGNREGDVYLPEALLSEFERYKDHVESELRRQAKPGTKEEDLSERIAKMRAVMPLVVSMKLGNGVRPVTDKMIYLYMRKLFSAAEILAQVAGDNAAAKRLQGFGAHSTRHTFVTAVYVDDKDIFAARDAARHKSISTTELYKSQLTSKTRKSIGALDDFLLPAPQPSRQ